MLEVKTEKKNLRHKLADVVPLKQPYVIFLDPCGCCNFKCSFCPVNTVTENIKERHKIMDMELFTKIVHDLKEFPEPIKVVELYAFGEPLLNKNICTYVKMLKECGKVEKVRITTNASLLNTELSKNLIDAGCDYIKISIESLYKEDYKTICGYEINMNDFISNITQLYNYICSKRINGSDKTAELGIKIFSNVLKDGDKEKFLKIFSPISDYAWIETAYNQWADFDSFLAPNGNEVDDEFTGRFEGRKLCSYPFTHMLVCSNGDIGLCCFDWNHQTKYANAKTISLAKAWNSKSLYEIRKGILQNKPIPFCSICNNKGYDNIDDDVEVIMRKIEMTRD